MNEETNTTAEVEQKASFDDVLLDKEYQKEFDRRISKAIDTAKSKWDAEAEAKKSEADKLAKMKAEEQLQYQLSKEVEKSANAIAELEAYKLKDEASKIAGEKNIPYDLLKLIEFKGNNAEKVKGQLETIQTVFNKAVEVAINERLKQNAPTQKIGAETSAEKAYLDKKYKNNPFYKG